MRFPYLKRIEDFDFAVQPAVDRRLIDELATGRAGRLTRRRILAASAQKGMS